MYFSDHSALDKQCVAVALLSALSFWFGMQARAAVTHTVLSPGCCLGDGVGAGSLLLAIDSRLRGVFPCVLSSTAAAACPQREKLFRTSSLDPFTSLELPREKLTSSPEMSVQCRLFCREPAGTAYFSPSIYQGRVKGSERTQEGDQAKFLEQGDPSGCVMVVFQQQKAREFCPTHDQDGKFRRPDKKETSHLNSAIQARSLACVLLLNFSSAIAVTYNKWSIKPIKK